ncbi:MAG: hypothetical protein HY658_02625 [Actinobacteria bacterium]|nr:hypothetical protein [Actinomycetota bacterium]
MARTTRIRDDFDVEVSRSALGYNLPQRLGRALWLPMLAMALMAFPAGAILGAVRANAIATGGSEKAIAALGQFTPAVNFLGFAAVFAAVSFAIARILGTFRVGGGQVQEAAGAEVHTLRMPNTGKVFIAVMGMAMMTLLGAVVLHAIIGASIAGDSAYALANAPQWSFWLEGARRIGIALYLLAIAFGLATIVTVLRYQAVRIRELPQGAASRPEAGRLPS